MTATSSPTTVPLFSPRTVAWLLQCVRVIHAAAGDALPWKQAMDVMSRGSEAIKGYRESDWNELVTALKIAPETFAASSALRADPEVLASLIAPADVYYQIARLLPHPDDTSAKALLSRILEQHILCAMEYRLRLLHERVTNEDLVAALGAITVANIVINRNGTIERMTAEAVELIGFTPFSAHDLERALPPLRKWIAKLRTESPVRGAQWEEGVTVGFGDIKMYVFGLRVNRPPLLYVFIDLQETNAAIRLAARAFRLTTREEEVLQHIIAGLPNTQIAKHLQISPDTVKLHVSRLLQKAGVRRRVDLVREVLALPRNIAPLSPLVKAS